MKRFADFQGDNLTGGSPFFNQDFFDSESEIYEVLKNMSILHAKKIGQDSFVLEGCAVTANGSNYDVAAGIVFLGDGTTGEIYRLPAQVAVTTGTKYIRSDADAVTTRTYGDASVKDFFVEKRAQVNASSGGGNEISFDPANLGSEFAIDLVGFSAKDGSDNVIRQKIVEIGDWNMDTSLNTDVDLGLPGGDNKKVRGIDVVIRNDADSSYYHLSQMDNGTPEIWTEILVASAFPGKIRIERRASPGIFDSAGFSTTPYNRGWILVTYVD